MIRHPKKNPMSSIKALVISTSMTLLLFFIIAVLAFLFKLFPFIAPVTFFVAAGFIATVSIIYIGLR